jgi:hypothetical protein
MARPFVPDATTGQSPTLIPTQGSPEGCDDVSAPGRVWRRGPARGGGLRAATKAVELLERDAGPDRDLLVAAAKLAQGLLAMVDVIDGRLGDAHDRLERQVTYLRRVRNLEGLANPLDTTGASLSRASGGGRRSWPRPPRRAAAPDPDLAMAARRRLPRPRPAHGDFAARPRGRRRRGTWADPGPLGRRQRGARRAARRAERRASRRSARGPALTVWMAGEVRAVGSMSLDHGPGHRICRVSPAAGTSPHGAALDLGRLVSGRQLGRLPPRGGRRGHSWRHLSGLSPNGT